VSLHDRPLSGRSILIVNRWLPRFTRYSTVAGASITWAADSQKASRCAPANRDVARCARKWMLRAPGRFGSSRCDRNDAKGDCCIAKAGACVR